jgi:hypothetical protein
MAKTSQNIVQNYFKRVFDDYVVLVQVNPATYQGIELIVHPDGKIEKTKMQYDDEIFEDLAADEFESASALEFNLYLKGLGSSK